MVGPSHAILGETQGDMNEELVSFVLLLLYMILSLICNFEIMSIHMYQTSLDKRWTERIENFEGSLENGLDLINQFRVTY